MSKIWLIARHEYATNIRRTGFIVFTLLVPFLGLVAMLIASFVGGRAGQFLSNQIEGEQKIIGVVDEYGAFNPILPEYSSEYELVPSEEAAREAIRNKELSVVMVIPPDYLSSGRVRVLSSDTTLQVMSKVDSDRTRAFLTSHLLRGKVEDQLYTRLEDPMNIERVDLSQAPGASGTTQSTGQVIGSILVPYFIGILLVMAIFTSSGYLMQSVTEEKSSRIIEIILSSVSARQMLAGKIIGMGALGLTQVLVWLAAAAGLSMGSQQLLGTAMPFIASPGVYLLIVVYFLLGFTEYAVLMGVSGALGTTQQEAQQISGLLSMLAAVPFFLAGFIMQNPNMGLARAISYFPLTAPTMMLLRIPMGSVPVIDIILSIAITGLTIPFLLWGGAKIFRMGLLVYGKRPSLAGIWKALKEA